MIAPLALVVVVIVLVIYEVISLSPSTNSWRSPLCPKIFIGQENFELLVPRISCHQTPSLSDTDVSKDTPCSKLDVNRSDAVGEEGAVWISSGVV